MKRKKVLTEIYKEIQKNYRPDEEYTKVEKEYIKEKENFLKIVGTKHQIALEKLTDSMYIMNNEYNRQMFIEGFSVAVKILLEATEK